MSRKRPTLQDVQRLSPGDLARCKSEYQWHLGTRIGKGSFGEVYLGWTSGGKEEVAVKSVSKSYFKQDAKVRENLFREIRIMQHLKSCEYVVRLHYVEEMKNHVVLVMELCEYDLDYLVKISPFRDEQITLFLFQLGQGMKALREQNIVHRDLKPGNILIKKDPVAGRMKIKLADFGFARHFTDEGTKKPIDMTSLAGTPVFMAPEALRCVFYPGEHYDDKVDIWSIGALLYKVIVGQCGFYAQLQDIPKILKHKKDAIAFERSGRSINYIQELPASVNDRLSPDYQAKMNTLLRQLLKLDPQERMNFDEFFEFVDDLVRSKIEIINILLGTSGKIMIEGEMTADELKKNIQAELSVPATHQLIFSPASPHSLSPVTPISNEHFTQLMEKCGASRGNGLLYLLPISELQRSESSTEVAALYKLKYAAGNETKCVELITDHKFTNDIVRAVNQLQTQQKRQETGVKEFGKYCSQEFEIFKTHGGYQEVYTRGLQTVAKVSLAAEWLEKDLEGLAALGGPHEAAQMILRTAKQHKTDVGKLVTELDTLYRSCEDQLRQVLCETSAGSGVDTTLITGLIKDAKLLPELRRVEMYGRCQMIFHKCEEMVRRANSDARHSLRKLYSSVANIWTMTTKSKQLTQLCQQVEDLLNRQIPSIRSSLLSSLTNVGTARDTPVAATPPSAPPVVVTPPGWPRPPPGPGGHSVPTSPYQPSPSSPCQPSPNSHSAHLPQVGVVSGQGSESKELTALRDDRDYYESLFQAKAEECIGLVKANTHLKEQLGQQRERNGSSSCDEEKTLAPGTTLRPTTPTEDRSLSDSLSPEDVRVLEALREQLKSFCTLANHLKPGVAAVTERGRSQTTPLKPAGSPTLYPSLCNPAGAEDYAVISMRGTPSAPDSVEQLIPHASQLMTALKDGLKDLSHSFENSVSAERTMVKIARPREYIQGDIVAFYSVLLKKSKTQVPSLLHSEKPYPYVFMDSSCYSAVGLRQGRVPDLLVARLLERPRAFRFEDDSEMSKEFPDARGEFYRIMAEATPFKFYPAHPPRPPPPKNRFPFKH